eukprot:scaffold8378_cov113-Isochrysis_galbana.AAC.3
MSRSSATRSTCTRVHLAPKLVPSSSIRLRRRGKMLCGACRQSIASANFRYGQSPHDSQRANAKAYCPSAQNLEANWPMLGKSKAEKPGSSSPATDTTASICGHGLVRTLQRRNMLTSMATVARQSARPQAGTATPSPAHPAGGSGGQPYQGAHTDEDGVGLLPSRVKHRPNIFSARRPASSIHLGIGGGAQLLFSIDAAAAGPVRWSRSVSSPLARIAAAAADSSVRLEAPGAHGWDGIPARSEDLP